MGFFNEIKNLFEEEHCDTNRKLIILGCGAVVEGFKKIITLSSSEIVFDMMGGERIFIKGKRLFIKKLEEREAVISGIVLAYEMLEAH